MLRKKKLKKKLGKRSCEEDFAQPPSPPPVVEDDQSFHENTTAATDTDPDPYLLPSPPPTPLDTLESVDDETVIGLPQILQRSWISPYTEAPATLCFGADETTFHVLPHFLPSDWIRSGPQERYYFPDIDAQTAHTLVHYLYRETYETIATEEDSSKSEARIKFKAALLVFIATSNHALPGLRRLATSEMNVHGLRLNIYEVLEIIDDDFPHICPNSWIHGYLHLKARTAFNHDHTVFTKEAFLQGLKNAALVKFMVRCIVNLYSSRLSSLIDTKIERDDQVQRSSDPFSRLDSTEAEQIATLNAPTVNELAVEQRWEPDARHTVLSDDFSTISCPCSETPACDAAPYLFEHTTEESCETLQPLPRNTRSGICEIATEAWSEPELEAELSFELEHETPDCISNTQLPAACEPKMDSAAEGSVVVPTKYDVSEFDVSPDCAAVRSWPCRSQVQHIFFGNGWKECTHCRVVVERLVMQMS